MFLFFLFSFFSFLNLIAVWICLMRLLIIVRGKTTNKLKCKFLEVFFLRDTGVWVAWGQWPGWLLWTVINVRWKRWPSDPPCIGTVWKETLGSDSFNVSFSNQCLTGSAHEQQHGIEATTHRCTIVNLVLRKATLNLSRDEIKLYDPLSEKFCLNLIIKLQFFNFY